MFKIVSKEELAPGIKKIEVEGIAIVSDSEKRIYREMKESMKKEIVSKREE